MRSKWAITLIICITLCLRISKTYTVASKSMPILQYSQIRVKLQNKLLHTNKTSNFSVSIINNSSTTTSSDKSSLSGTNQSLNQIFTSTLAYSENPTTFTIYNYQSTIKNLTISLQSTTNVSVPEYVILLSQSKQESTFLAIIDDIVTSGYMLPFNMLNIKESNIIVIQHDSSLVQKSYNLPPFANTYWTENSITATMMPWLPYFSKCTFQKKYILLNDILKPGFCRTDDQQIVVCSPKTFQFDCIVEQFQVKNATSEYWFNQKQAILFYLYPTKMDYLELDALKSNKDNLTTLITNFHSSLIPVLYRRQSADQVIVNSFQININILLTLKQDAVITYAEIIGDYDADIKSPNGKVYVNVSYDFFESFLFYGFSIQWYILYCFIFLGVIFMILFCLAKKFNMKNLSKKVKLIVAPAIKGVALSLITAGNFIILMHLISNYSNFSGIIATFDSNQSGQTLQYNNMGRYGLTIFITGLYILTSGIKQTFKVNEQQELKIAFEDDKTKFQNEQQLKTKIEFSRDNLFSYRKYLFNGSIVNLLTTILIFFICSNLTNFQMAMVQLFVIPVLGNAYIAFQNDFLFRNNLFGCSTLASAAVLFHFFILGNQCIQEMTYLYICYFLSHMVFMPLYSILISWLLLKLEANKQSTKIAEILCSISIIQKKIQILKCQSQYQQALYYSNFNVSVLIKIFLLPFCLIFIYLTQNQNQISKIFFVKDYSILVTFVVCILGMIVQTYTVLFIVQFLKKQFGIRVQQVMKYNSFRFTRTKFRWMNDVFAESKYIREEFRQYEKFAFSSQLYFVISLNTIGLQTMFLGAMIMLYIQYLPFYDPATVVIFVTVWILGQVLSIIVSVVGIRLKLYEKKGNESIKQKLAKMDKYLKPDDKKQYLQLDGVKDFFLISNKEWIINNLHMIFTKEDLKARNYELINKYKEYKRNFKRKQIDQKKQQNQLKLMSNTIQCRPSISEQPYLVVKNKRVFTVTKPIALYWHCMAKQNLYLKNIVVCVKKQKIKTVCEYCNMDIYLQAVQKYDFHDIVNSYRVQNVGKMFDQQAFLQYYRINQHYVTICLECKQKNMHLHTKIEKKSVAYKLMFCWLMTARSNILHKRDTVND